MKLDTQRNQRLKILIDTNVLFSAILFPQSDAAKVVLDVSNKHELCLCSQNIIELKEIVKRKIPDRQNAINDLFKEMSFTLIPMSVSSAKTLRDETDIPILNSAIQYNVDVIITGDKDFLEAKIKRPSCITIREYMETMFPE